MATSGAVIKHLAKVSGDLPSTLDRMLRPLRAAGLAPFGDPGRGQKHGHYELAHLTNLLLAFGGSQPSDAVDAVRSLRPLAFSRSEPAADAPYLEGPDLGTTIERVIGGMSLAGGLELAKFIPVYAPEISFCLNPLCATLAFAGPGETRRTDLYLPAQTALPHISQLAVPQARRTTTLGFGLLVAAAELLSDTQRHQMRFPSPSNGSEPFHVSRNAAPVDALPETAASLPGEAAATRDQSAQTELDGVSQAHPTGERELSTAFRLAGRSLPSINAECLMTEPETVALAVLPRELAMAAGKPAPGYRHLYNLVLDGRIPATLVNRRWQVARTDIPSIAALLGLVTGRPAPKRRKG